MLVRRVEGGRHRGHDHAAAARARAGLHPRQGPGRIRAVRCGAVAASSRRRARTPRCSKRVVYFHSDGAGRARSADGAAERRASTTSFPRATMSRSSPSPRARPVRPRARCIFTATCWRSATASRAPSCSPSPTTSSPAARPSPSPSGSAACCCSRCASAPRRCCSSAARRRSCCRRSSDHRLSMHLHRAHRLSRDGRIVAKHSTSRACRKCVSAGEHLPAATFEAWRKATGIDDHRRAGLDRTAAHLHLLERRGRAARRHRQAHSAATRR